MNPGVEEYLAQKKAQADQVKSETLKREEAAKNEYRRKVIRAAGLLEDKEQEVDRDRYNYYDTYNRRTEKDEEGKTHYFIVAPQPIEVSDEEFAEIEKTFTPEELEPFRKHLPDEEADRPRSWAAGFCTGIAWLLFIGGFIVAIVSAMAENVLTNKETFSFSVFLSTYAVYVIAGCFALCMRELFEQLQRIVNLLQKQ